MNNTIELIDFNFSRPLDIQKNLSIEKVRNFFSKIFDLDFKNDLLEKHLKLLVIELFYCWYESENQFLSLSMSKRGYNSKSRYNPNEISSYTIKAVNFLKEKKLIDFFPGFFDRKSYVRRLTRIRPSKKLKSFFSNSILTIEKKINHPNRVSNSKDNYKKLLEYSDNFQTHEIRELLTGYNNLISKSLIDIPVHEQNYLERYDKKKIIISETNSQANLFCLNNFNNIQGFSGCWWNELDINLIMRYEKLLVNNQPTTYVDLNDIFIIFYH